MMMTVSCGKKKEEAPPPPPPRVEAPVKPADKAVAVEVSKKVTYIVADKATIDVSGVKKEALGGKIVLTESLGNKVTYNLPAELRVWKVVYDDQSVWVAGFMKSGAYKEVVITMQRMKITPNSFRNPPKGEIKYRTDPIK